MAEARFEASEQSSLLFKLCLFYTVSVHIHSLPSLAWEVLSNERLHLIHRQLGCYCHLPALPLKDGPLKAETQVLAWIKAGRHAHTPSPDLAHCHLSGQLSQPTLPPAVEEQNTHPGTTGRTRGKGALMGQKQTSGVINLAFPSTLCLSRLIM